MKGRDFLTLQDYSREEILSILEQTRMLKKGGSAGEWGQALAGRSIALIFEKPSTRTRVSFEVAVGQLGGRALHLGWNELQLGRGETVADTARVLDRYVDGVVARVFAHRDLEEMARHAEVPVINALSDLYHPCQAVCDLYTIWEKRRTLRGVRLAYVGDGNNVCNSLLIGCSRVGVDITVACPREYRPPEQVLSWALENAARSRSSVRVVEDPREAVEGADVVYTDVFVSMGMEEERRERLRAFLPKYQVNRDLMGRAAEGALFMHCLPAHRGEEVTDEVIDGPRSIVWDQAENRLHTAKALLTLLF